MKGFLVLSNRHELVPLYHRLRREGHETHLVVWNSRFESVWDGLATKLVRRSDSTLTPENLIPAIEAAKAGDLTVLTTVPLAAQWFGDAQRLYGPGPTSTPPADHVLFGGWFTGEEVKAPHLLVADWGAWAGGQGATVLGGLTLVRPTGDLPTGILTALAKATDTLKAASYRGLFHFDVVEDPSTGELLLRGLQSGWGTLHTHAFVAELESLGAVLLGEAPTLARRFVTVLPVTQPPWPSARQGERRAPTEVGGLTPTQQGKVFWHDITVDKEHRKLFTAGLDGMVGVVTGSSDGTPSLARARALELAVRMELVEKQYRTDVGALVDPALATLEERWGVVL